MKRFLLSFFAVMLAVFSVQAEEYSYTFTSKQFSANGTKTLNSVNWTLAGEGNYWGYDGTKGQQFGSGSAPYQSLTLSTSDIKGTITKIVINTSGASSVNASFTVSVGGTQYGGSTKLTTSATNYTFEGSASGEIKFSYTQTSKKAIYIKSIEVTYTPTTEGGDDNEEPETPVAPDAPTLPATQSFDNSMTVEITNIAEGATVYYTTDGSEPTATSTKYTAPFEITATTTVKAIAVNEGVSSEVVSATYTKNVPVDPNAKTATLSFASTDQRKSQTTSQQVWEQNGVTFTNNKSGSTSDIIDSSNPVRLYKSSEIIVECALGNIVAIEFDCDNSDNKYLTSLSDIITGCSVNDDKVTVALSGTSNKYELSLTGGQVRLDAITVTYLPGATKPMVPTLTAGGNFVGSKSVAITCATEGAKIYYTTNGDEPTAANGTEYSAPFEITKTTTVKAIAVNKVGESGVAIATYTRVAATPVIKFEGEASAFEGEVVVSIETENNAVAYYTLNGVAPSASSTVYEEPITIKANVILKVIAIEAGEYKSDVKTQEFVMAVTGSDNIEGESCTLSFADKAQRTDFSTSKQVWKQNGITLTNNKGNGNNVADYAAPVRFYKNSEIIVEFTSPIAKIVFACNTSEYATNLKNSIPGSTVSGNTVTVQLDGSSNSFTIGNLSGGQVRMDALTVTPVAEVSASSFNLTIGNAGWATLFLGYNVIIPEDVDCYVISSIEDGAVKLEAVTGILPANTAVIVAAAEGEHTFAVTEETANVVNVMEGTLKNQYITKEAYVLGIVDGVVGLYKAEMAGGVWLNNANKAYLPASKVPAEAQGAANFSFRFGEGTTGISEVKTENGEVKTIYDLTGRRVEAITAPGIYIVGGKKVLVK